MGKLSKFFLVFGIMFLIIIIAFYMVYATTFKADNIFCQQQLMQPNKNDNFFILIGDAAEGHEDEIDERGYSTRRTWRDLDYRYMIFNYDPVLEVYQNPSKYFSDALKVVASPDYDQTQKMYTLLMMQDLPIKKYMCLMDIANTAYEHGIITDKEVLSQAIHPDSNLFSTSTNYWWLPDWQQRFNKHANELFSQDHIKSVLSGDYGNIWRD